MSPLRFRLWHLMALVAMVGLIASGLFWLFPPAPEPGWWVSVVVAGYKIPLTWPVLLAIAGALLTVFTGIFGVLLALLVRATK
jgi:uncharacterized membrane protein